MKTKSLGQINFEANRDGSTAVRHEWQDLLPAYREGYERGAAAVVRHLRKNPCLLAELTESPDVR